MKIGANNSGGSGGVVVKELLDRVHEEYGLLQQQLHNTRMELEKCQQERDGIQRYTIVVCKFILIADKSAFLTFDPHKFFNNLCEDL